MVVRLEVNPSPDWSIVEEIYMELHYSAVLITRELFLTRIVFFLLIVILQFFNSKAMMDRSLEVK